MSSDRAPDSLVSAWQEQPTSGFRMVPSDVARKIRADARLSRRALGIGIAVFAAVFVVFGTMMVSQPDPVRRFAHVVQLLGIAFFVGQFIVHRRRVRAARFDVDRTTVPSLTSARAYLETRRVFHSGTWLWSRVAVLFPGPPIEIYGQARTGVIPMEAVLPSLLTWVALLAFAAFVVQRREARNYERLLHELDDIEGHSPLERFVAAHEQWKDR